MPSALPTRGALDLGAALTNVRTPAANELSAVNVERIKDWIIAIATELGLLDGSTPGSVWEAILAAAGITQITGDGTAGPGSGAQALTVTQARGLRETAGPTTLAMGAVADGEVLRRSGSTLVGFASGFTYSAIAGNATLPAHDAILDVDTTAVSAPGTLTLTLPTPSGAAGRTYVVRKILGAADETITLARFASEQIDGLSSSRILTGSDQEVVAGSYGAAPTIAWVITCDGTNWRTTAIGASVRHRVFSGAPSDSTHYFTSEQGYMPGSTWCDSSTGRLWINVTSPTISTAAWHRLDALDPLSVVTTAVTLPSKDTAAFVDTATAGGNVTLTLPSPTGRNAGRQFVITRVNSSGTNKITLARAASENINGTGASYDLPGSSSASYGRWHVISDGTNWWVTGGSGL